MRCDGIHKGINNMRVSPLVHGQSLCTEGSRSCQWRPSWSWTASAPPSRPVGTRSVHPDQIHQACTFLRLLLGRRCPRCAVSPFDTVSAWGSRQYTSPQECSFSWMSSDLTTNYKMLWHTTKFLRFTYLHQNTPSYLASLLRPLFSFWILFACFFVKCSFLHLVHMMMGRLANLASPPKNPHHLVHRQVWLTVTGPDQEPSVSWTISD